MKGVDMDRRRNILKNTFKFAASFIVINILFLFVVVAFVLYSTAGKNINSLVPISRKVNPDDLDWEAINEIGGWGIVVDNEGNVVKSYYQEDDKKSYTYIELVDLFDIRHNDKTAFSYGTVDGNKLIIIYPSLVFQKYPP